MMKREPVMHDDPLSRSTYRVSLEGLYSFVDSKFAHMDALIR